MTWLKPGVLLFLSFVYVGLCGSQPNWSSQTCISVDFPVTIIKCPNKGSLREKRVILMYRSRGMQFIRVEIVYSRRGGLGSHTMYVVRKQRMSLKWNPKNVLRDLCFPVCLHLQKVPQSSQTAKLKEPTMDSQHPNHNKLLVEISLINACDRPVLPQWDQFICI